MEEPKAEPKAEPEARIQIDAPPALAQRFYIQRETEEWNLTLWAGIHVYNPIIIITTYIGITDQEKWIIALIVMALFDIVGLCIVLSERLKEWGNRKAESKCPFYPTPLDRRVWWLDYILGAFSIGLVVAWYLAVCGVIPYPYSHIPVGASFVLVMIPVGVDIHYISYWISVQNIEYKHRYITEPSGLLFVPEYKFPSSGLELQQRTLWDPNVLGPIAQFMPRSQLE